MFQYNVCVGSSTPQGKSVYQAFIDNFDKDYDAESFRKDEKGSIGGAFQWDICPEDLEFWYIVDNKWQEVTDPENDMLWLLDGKEPLDDNEIDRLLDEVNNIDGKRKQIGGNHYAKHTIQPWDIIREYELDFFEGSCISYILRRKNNRLEDLQKAAHYLEECIKNEQKRIDNV